MRRRPALRGLLRALGGLLAAAAVLSAAAQPVPEIATGWTNTPPLSAREALVVSAHPLASRAGLEALEAGGSAIDAAIAVQMVLNVVEPQSSGIGGGAFLLYYDVRRGRMLSWDGRETAPLAAGPDLFLDAQGEPMRFADALVGGRSVGTPGVLRLLEAAHRRYGRLAWRRLFERAIEAAEEGFPVSPRLHESLQSDPFLRRDPAARALFYAADGRALPAGSLLRNPALAQTLNAIARGGAEAFYRGPIAQDIVAAVRGHRTNPGLLSLEDLRRYRALERDPVCLPYQGYRVCSVPPPSSGGLVLLQVLGVLERTGQAALAPDSALSVHLFDEASRLAFADRDRYAADPAFVPVPVRGLLEPAYLDARRALIDPRRSIGIASPGRPAGAPAFGPGRTFEMPSTTHFSIVDREGNALAMTSSVESAFGSRTLVRGFLLNNELTDFSFAPARGGVPVANRVEPGKRPRSTMTPTIVLDARGRVKLVAGSPGGPWIAGFVAQLVNLTLGQGVPLEQALAFPHWGSRNGPAELEAGRAPAALRSGLEQLGETVREMELTSGLNAIERVGEHWVGAGDPRREGRAAGR